MCKPQDGWKNGHLLYCGVMTFHLKGISLVKHGRGLTMVSWGDSVVASESEARNLFLWDNIFLCIILCFLSVNLTLFLPFSVFISLFLLFFPLPSIYISVFHQRLQQRQHARVSEAQKEILGAKMIRVLSFIS